MPRSTRSPKLETRTTRLKLPIAGKPVFVRVAPGVSLGYRRNVTAGTWVLRVGCGRNGAWTKRLAIADDFDNSDGCSILTYWEAQTLAKETAGSDPNGASRAKPLTVEIAVSAYLASLEARNPRTARDARSRLTRLFLPKFGSMRIRELTRRQIEEWRDGLVRHGVDDERRRKSQDTANRVLSIVKAALNHAIGDPANKLSDDSAWRLVRPYQRVSRARDVHFSIEEVRRLLDVADTPEFRDLLIAGFLTGARYGELTACRVRDFSAAKETLWLPRGKTGPRIVILQTEAVDFFSRIAGDRPADDPLLVRSDNRAWKPSDQQRPMQKAVREAALDTKSTFYTLRHSYISRAIELGMPLTVLAENCGTSVRMIETTYAKVLAEKRRDFIAAGAPRLFAA